MPRLAGLGGFARMFAGYRMAFTAAHAGLAYQREQDEMSLAGNDPMKQYQASMGAVNSIENSGMIGLAISEGMRLLGYDHTQSDSQVASAIAQENSAQRILDLQQRTRNQTAMTQASGMRGLARENELSRIHHDEEIQRIYKEREKEKEELSSNENTENVAARKYTATSEDEALALRRVPEKWSGGGPWAPSIDLNASSRQEELERIVQAKITAAENDIHKKYDSSSAGARGLTQKMNDEFERQKTAADRAMEFANREASRQVTNETSVLAARNANDENLAGARELINKIQSNITPGGKVPNDVANLGRQQIVEYGRMHGLFGAGGALLRKQWADLYGAGESGPMSPAETGVIGPHPDAEGMSHGWYDQFHRWHENRQGSWESNNQGRSWHHPSQHRTPEELRRLQWAHKPVGGKLGELMYGGDDDDVFPMRKSGGRHFTWPHRGDFQDDSYFWGDGAPHDSERALSYHFARSLEGSHKAYGFRDMDEIRRASKYLDQTRWIQAGAPGEHVHDIGEQSLSERYAHAMEGEHGKYGFRDMNEVRRMSHYADIQRAKDHLEKRTQDFLEGEHGETWRAWRAAHPSHHVLSNAEQHDRNIRNHGPMSQLSHAMEGLGGIFGFVASSMMHNAGAEKLNSAHGKVSAGESSNSAQKLSGATDKFEKAAKQIYDAVTNAPNLVVANLYS